jgi:beta-galactosidase
VNGVDGLGKRLHYYFNYSGNSVSFTYANPAGKDLLTNMPIATSQQITLAPWDLSIVEEP